MRKIDQNISMILEQFNLDPKEALWDCHGTWVMYHKYCERVGAKLGIEWKIPVIIEADYQNKTAVILVSGTVYGNDGNTVTEWSIGEAHPSNNRNAYIYAMAEKRGKDRVILKLSGLHGFVYSEDESDDFKPKRIDGTTPKNGEMTVDQGLKLDKLARNKAFTDDETKKIKGWMKAVPTEVQAEQQLTKLSETIKERTDATNSK